MIVLKEAFKFLNAVFMLEKYPWLLDSECSIQKLFESRTFVFKYIKYQHLNTEDSSTDILYWILDGQTAFEYYWTPKIIGYLKKLDKTVYVQGWRYWTSINDVTFKS